MKYHNRMLVTARLRKLAVENGRLLAQVEGLKREIQRVQDSNDEAAYYMDQTNARLERRLREAREAEREAERRLEQEKTDQYYRDSERDSLMKKLERAESWGDTWGADRIKRQIKNL